MAGIEIDWLGYVLMAIGLLWGLAYAVYYFFFRREPGMGEGDHIHIEIHGNQLGGTNIGKAIFNAPKAGVRPEIQVVNGPMEDGNYLTRAVLHVDSRHAASGFRVVARGEAICGFAFEPIEEQVGPGISAVNTGQRGRFPDFPRSAMGTAGAPLARRYVTEVITNKPDDVTFNVDLDD